MAMIYKLECIESRRGMSLSELQMPYCVYFKVLTRYLIMFTSIIEKRKFCNVSGIISFFQREVH